jgi:hypothetical protein
MIIKIYFRLTDNFYSFGYRMVLSFSQINYENKLKF